MNVKIIISALLCFTIGFSQESYSPNNLSITNLSLFNVSLAWDIPEAYQHEHVTHHNGAVPYGIGNGNGSPVGYFQKLSPEMLELHSGKTINSMTFNTMWEGSFQPLVFVTSGVGTNLEPDLTNLSNCLLTGPPLVNATPWTQHTVKLYDYNYQENVMGDVTTLSSLTINPNVEVWFGVIVSDYNALAQQFAMGADDGPQVEGFGNLVCYLSGDGQAPTNSGYYQANWTTLTESNPALTYNFALRLDLVEDNSLINYNIYEDGTQIRTIIASCNGLNCQTENAALGMRPQGNHEYHVTSVFSDFESGPSNVINVEVANTQPNEFTLIEPNEDEVLSFSQTELSEIINFRWWDTDDIDGQSIAYDLRICNDNQEPQFCWSTPLEQSDITIGPFCRVQIEVQNLIDYLDINENENNLSWTVVASDGLDETQSTTEDETGYHNFSLIFDFLHSDYEPVADQFRLYPNAPNPFNPTTALRYYLPRDEFVTITIYDMLGNIVRNLVHEYQSTGHKSVQWDATNNFGESVSAGVYLNTIVVGDIKKTQKMILLK